MSRTHVPWRCGQDVFRILVVCVWFDYVLRGASDRGVMKDGCKDGREEGRKGRIVRIGR